MKRLIYYIRIWWLMSKNSFQMVLSQKFGFAIFLAGKILRFGMALLFLSFLFNGTGSIAGYTATQAIFIFLTFNVVDVFSQFFFREVYRFRPQVVSGGFDLTLTKPMSALFRSLGGGADIIDAVTIPPLLLITYLVGRSLAPLPIDVVLYLLLVANGLIIAMAFHITALAFGIITLEIDHTIMIYRDFARLGSMPADIYKEPIRSVLTYIIPIALMVTFPARTLYGMTSLASVLAVLLVGGLALFVSLRFWHFALSKYTSASS